MGIVDSDKLVDKFTNESTEKTEIDQITSLIAIEKIKFNEITRNFESNSQVLTDRMLASFYTKVWQRIDDKIGKDKIFTIIQDQNITPAFNPITQWFDSNKHLTPNNEFEKLKKCFVHNHVVMFDNELVNFDTYVDVFVKKWLLGIVSSCFGTYSLLILVLNGLQGTNKTEFFRNLLPIGLKSFYAESNLDEGKDSEILMTKKLLIIDDEFGGKSKKDAQKLKRLSSQQTFSVRMPYGKISEDLNRLAVLGGTTNDAEIINDTTGNRRIIPLNLVSFDIAAFRAIDKDLLFVELYNEWQKDKTSFFLTKEEIELLNGSTEENIETMAEVELIQKHFEHHNYIEQTNTDIRVYIESKYPTIKTNSKRIGQALKKLGYNPHVVFRDEITRRVYLIVEK